MTTRIKALIADDSVIYRSQIKAALSTFPWVEVIGVAANGRLALEKLKQSPVDLLILDLEMPEMNGLQTLRALGESGLTTKVLVFSSASQSSAAVTFEALRMGAKDFVAKPGATGESLVEQAKSGPADTIRGLLEPKLQALFPEHAGRGTPGPQPPAVFPGAASAGAMTKTSYLPVLWEAFRPKVVVIGSSTGGPTALESLLTALGGMPRVPLLIAQHMPPVFTAGLAERLMKVTGIPAAEGRHGERVQGGRIYIAPGDFHMTMVDTGSELLINLDKGPQVNSVRPAVDPLFESAAQIFRRSCLGVVLTGMGQDGMVGAQAIKAAGGAVLIQDGESCVVNGMPGAVHRAGAYDKAANPLEIAALIRAKIIDAAFPLSGTTKLSV